MSTLHLQKRRAARQREADSIHQIVGTVVSQIEFRDGYHLETGNEDDRIFIQLAVWRLDTVTKEMGWGHSGKAWIGAGMSKSDIVRVCFGLIRGYNEHEDREFFKYRGTRIFGPHQDVDLLVNAGRPTDLVPIYNPDLMDTEVKTFESKPWWRP